MMLMVDSDGMWQHLIDRVALVTDAWKPQVNGVVTTWTHVRSDVEATGRTMDVIHPGTFRTIPCPRYPEIRLALFPDREVDRRLTELSPDAVHIATEGPLGLAARRWCVRNGAQYTTSFHTQFPAYLFAYARIHPRWTHRALRWFHGRGAATLVPTRSVQRELEAHGYRNVRLWTRGVDTELFKPRPRRKDVARPVQLYVGRVTREKNLRAFLELNVPGTRCVVGEGPELAALRRKFPDVQFLGYRHGEELARIYADADVFVFPSRTDTFGLVMLEAMACGVPVAAFPVTGPIDVVSEGVSGCLHEDLEQAVVSALRLCPDACRAYAETFSWQRCADLFLASLVPTHALGRTPGTTSQSTSHDLAACRTGAGM